MTTYAERLQALMDEKPIDRTALSKELGCTYQAVRKVLELGGKFGSALNLKAATYFKVNPTWLDSGEGEKYPKSYVLKAETGSFHLSTNGMSAHAIALGKLFDRVPTTDPVLWSAAYQKAGQVLLDAIQGTQQTESQGLDQENTSAPRQVSPGKQKTAS